MTNTNTAPALREALEAAQQAIISMKVEAETAAQGDEQMMLEACEQISNEGLAADMAIRQALSAAAQPPAGMVLVPDFRGYANLGTGQYCINHSGSSPAELIISIATAEEKMGRKVGEERDNPEGAVIEPEVMAVRLRFSRVEGLDSLEKQLRYLREVHFAAAPKEAKTEPVQQSEREPLTAREIELIDGMIEVQLHHAIRSDNIGNRPMAEKQKAWDMERVDLLKKLKASYAPRESLTDVEIARLAKNTHADLWGEGLFRFARAIEAAHGITTQKEQG